MCLQTELHELPLGEWNDLVRGVVEAWEVARLLGCERVFEYRLAADRDGSVTRAFAAGGQAVIALREGARPAPSGEVSELVHSLCDLGGAEPPWCPARAWEVLAGLPGAADEEVCELRAQVA